MRRLREIDPERPSGMCGGHVEIVDFGEMDLRRPDGRPVVRRPISRQERRVAVTVLAIALLGSSLWAWSQPRASATSSSPSPSAVAETDGASTAGPSRSSGDPTVPASPVAPIAVSTAPPSTTEPSPVVGGWSVRVDVPMGSGTPSVVAGPDGTLYVSGAVPIDRAGNPRTGWLQVPGGEVAQPVLFSPSGQIYGVTRTSDAAVVWGFRPNGEVMYSFSLPSTVWITMALTPGGIDVVVPSDVDVAPGGVMPDQVLVIDDKGTLVAHWSLDGTVIPGDSEPTQPQFFVRYDGTIVASVLSERGCATHYLDPSGEALGPARLPCWNNLAQAPDGSILARSCDRYESGLNAYSVGFCLETTVAILDDTGRPANGWPQRVAGELSPPAFDGGGRVYFGVNDLGAGTTGITALDVDGTIPGGWPVTMDASSGVLDPRPPIVVPDRLFAWSGSSLYSFGLDGARLAGSPTDVAEYTGWPTVFATGGPGALFFNTADGVEAIFLDGSVAGIYKEDAADIAEWLDCVPVQGGAIALSYHAGNNRAYLDAAFLPATGF
jgi:hypothetical protein